VTLEGKTRFDPPEDGLFPGESVVWSRRAGTSFWVIFNGACLCILAPMVAIFSYEQAGAEVGNLMMFLLLGGALYLVWVFVKDRRTMYYLTNERIIEVRARYILRQIPLDCFSGIPHRQFLESKVDHTSNGRPIYNVRISDPVSSAMIVLKRVDGESVRVLEKIGDTF
jgi:hypothetical protein